MNEEELKMHSRLSMLKFMELELFGNTMFKEPYNHKMKVFQHQFDYIRTFLFDTFNAESGSKKLDEEIAEAYDAFQNLNTHPSLKEAYELFLGEISDIIICASGLYDSKTLNYRQKEERYQHAIDSIRDLLFKFRKLQMIHKELKDITYRELYNYHIKKVRELYLAIRSYEDILRDRLDSYSKILCGLKSFKEMTNPNNRLTIIKLLRTIIYTMETCEISNEDMPEIVQ